MTTARKKYSKAHFFGKEGSGKTGGAMRYALALHKALGGKAAFALFDTGEGIADHWADALEEATGAKVVVDTGDTPAQLLAFIDRCELYTNKTGDDVILIVDSGTDVALQPRESWAMRNPGKDIPYATVDQAIKPLVRKLKTAKLHWIMTFREKDDRAVNDRGVEVVDGKKGKAAADLEFVARVKAHCRRKAAKPKPVIEYAWTIDHGPKSQIEVMENATSEDMAGIVSAYAVGKVEVADGE